MFWVCGFSVGRFDSLNNKLGRVVVVGVPEVDSISGHWDSFVQGMKSGGFVTTQNPDSDRSGSLAAIVFINRPSIRSIARLLRVPRKRRVILVLEPRVSDPLTHRILPFFGHVFLASPLWEQRRDHLSFKWPQQLPSAVTEIPSGASPSYQAVMINANKRSAVPGSLYGLRRRVVREALKNDVRLVVAGDGWSRTMLAELGVGLRAIVKSFAALSRPVLYEALSQERLPSHIFLGPIQTKSELLQNASYAIVIENSADYVSEKLFDAIGRGACPIYVGPNLENFGIPNDVALTVDPNPQAIVQAILQTPESLRRMIVERGRKWICSHETQAFDGNSVLFQLGVSLAESITRTLRSGQLFSNLVIEIERRS